jgi:hypothetical protein
MTRHLFFAIAVLGTGVLVNSPADAVTPLQCEERNANCLGTCRDVTGGAGDWRGHQNKCVRSCIGRLTRCYTISRPLYSAPRI